LRQFVQPALLSIRLDILEPLVVDPRRAAVGLAAEIGMSQNVLPIHLVVQSVEAKTGRFLRFCV
jgi:hypothetical protein